MQYISQQDDWLVQPFCQPASVEETDDRLILDNGLIRRTFVTSPNFATQLIIPIELPVAVCFVVLNQRQCLRLTDTHLR